MKEYTDKIFLLQFNVKHLVRETPKSDEFLFYLVRPLKAVALITGSFISW